MLLCRAAETLAAVAVGRGPSLSSNGHSLSRGKLTARVTERKLPSNATQPAPPSAAVGWTEAPATPVPPVRRGLLARLLLSAAAAAAAAAARPAASEDPIMAEGGLAMSFVLRKRL